MQRRRQDLDRSAGGDVPEARQQAAVVEAGQKRPDRLTEGIGRGNPGDAREKRVPRAHDQVRVGREDAEDLPILVAITRHWIEPDAPCLAGLAFPVVRTAGCSGP